MHLTRSQDPYLKLFLCYQFKWLFIAHSIAQFIDNNFLGKIRKQGPHIRQIWKLKPHWMERKRKFSMADPGHLVRGDNFGRLLGVIFRIYRNHHNFFLLLTSIYIAEKWNIIPVYSVIITENKVFFWIMNNNNILITTIYPPCQQMYHQHCGIIPYGSPSGKFS